MRSLIHAGSTAILCLLVASCATPGPTIETMANAAFHPSPGETYAFLPEPDIRPQKRDLYARASGYLAKTGFTISDPRTADYLIVVAIQGPNRDGFVANSAPSFERPPPKLQNSGVWGTFTGPPALAASSHPSALPPRNESIDSRSDKFAFGFGLFRRDGFDKGNMEPLWTAVVLAVDTDFRAHEEEYILAVFSHVGETHTGHISLQKTKVQ